MQYSLNFKLGFLDDKLGKYEIMIMWYSGMEYDENDSKLYELDKEYSA